MALTPSSEPVALSTAVQILLIAVIVGLQAFNVWDPTQDQYNAVLGLYAAFVLVLGVLTRNKVTPV